MKLCPNCEPRALCCDHCAYFQFNGDNDGAYTGNGWCRLHKRAEDPASLCDEYFCFQLLAKDRPNVDASTSSQSQSQRQKEGPSEIS